jgi:hypothetical protein
MSESDTKSLTPSTSTTKFSMKEYQHNYQHEKREGVYKQLEKINRRLDTLEELFDDKKTMQITMQEDTSEWSFSDIKCFIKQVGEIASEKYNKKFATLSPKDMQKYFQLDKYSQIYNCLKW